FHSHVFEASISIVPVGVRKSDERCNLNADLTVTRDFRVAPVRTLCAVARTPRAFTKFQSLFKPLRFCCCEHAQVRILLPSPPAYAGAQPLSAPPRPLPASWRFCRRARPAAIPI